MQNHSPPRVTSVHYAQHEHVVAYPWKALRHRWDADPRLAETIGAVENGEGRPLAFSASGTHSSHSRPCRETIWNVGGRTLEYSMRVLGLWASDSVVISMLICYVG